MIDINTAYAEGMDDSINGDNLNPFDPDTQPDEWKSYEKGYIQGVMSDWVGEA